MFASRGSRPDARQWMLQILSLPMLAAAHVKTRREALRIEIPIGLPKEPNTPELRKVSEMI